jgi:hypothetical protein
MPAAYKMGDLMRGCWQIFIGLCFQWRDQSDGNLKKVVPGMMTEIRRGYFEEIRN